MSGIIKKNKNLFGEEVTLVIPEECKRLVEEVLRENAQARNDDMELYIEVWKKQGIIPEWEQIKRFGFKPETMGRVRRKFQELGMYPAYKPVKDSRVEKQKEYRDYFSHQYD